MKKSVKLGFHSHNNQQMAFANALAFLRYFDGSDRDIIVDASLCGMGRGAGNATTELLTSYLNRKCHKNYNMDMILDTIDVYMTPFREKYTWGYSTPYFIAGTYCCHVNNIAYLTDHHRTTAKDMRNIIASLSPEDRLKYDYDLLEEKYVENQSRLVDDELAVRTLKQAWCGRTLLLIAPGRSAATEQNAINRYIAEHDVVTVAVNAILPGYAYDYLFLTNRVRYDYARENHRAEFDRLEKVILSNIRTDAGEKELLINFNRAVKRGWEHFDNAVICCLRLLDFLGVQDIVIAGFDGFRHAYNESYADPSLPSVGGDIDYDALNDEIRDMYRDFIASAGERMQVKFLTESYFAG
jgi:4-hydroxy 2-oxovalerate aldolase